MAKRAERWAMGHSTSPSKVELKYTRRNRFWSWAKAYCDARWLKSHGWIETRQGWLLPHWHPKLIGQTKFKSRFVTLSTPGPGPIWNPDYREPRWAHSLRAEDHLGKRGPIKELGEPYDLNHAVNSQRAHTEIHPAEAMLPISKQDAPAFPSYIMWKNHELLIPAIANWCGFASAVITISYGKGWVSGILLVIAAMFLVASRVVARKVRKDWELDWAESQLLRTGSQLNKGTSN